MTSFIGILLLLQHFLSVDYVKKNEEEKKRGRDDAWEQDEFVSFKSIENDRSACVYVSLLYHRSMPSYLTCSYVSVFFFFLFFKEVQSQSR